MRFARQCLIIVLLCALPAAAQTPGVGLVVNGNPLPVSRPAEQRGGQWFIPLTPVVRALGFEVRLAPEIDGLRVARNAGPEAVFDGQTGEIRFGPVVAGQLKNFRQISIAGSVEDLLFPIDGVVVLLGVEIHYDPDRNDIRIDRSAEAQNISLAGARYDLANVEYTLGASTNFHETGHYTLLRSDSIAAGIPLSSSFLLSGRGSEVALRQGSLQAKLGRGLRLTAGDQTAYFSLDSMVSSLRGFGFSRASKSFETQLVAGRAVSSSQTEFGVPGLAVYDTNLASLGFKKKSATSELSLSANTFAGPERRGTSGGVSFLKTTARNQFRLQGAGGGFSGVSERESMSVKTPVKGAASGFSLFDSFTPLERLTMTAQIDRYGRNFLTAREDSQFNAQSTRRLNVAVRPFKQMSFFGGVNDRVFLLGDSKPLRGYSYGAGAPLPLTRSVQLSFFRSVQNDLSASQGSFDMTQYSAAVMGIRGYSATVIYSRTRFGGAPAGNLSFAANKDYGSRGRFSVHDQIQPGTTHRYGVEWQIDLAAGSFRAGLDRMTNRRSRAAGFFPLLSVGLKLPGGQHLYLSYSGDKTTKTLSLVVSGSAIKRHEIERYTDGRFAAASAALAGRVYYDSDNDGAFSETADKPIAEVPVWIDDRISVQTDSHGFFRFSELEPGAHSIRADLAGVPADLVFAQEAERIVAALPNRTTTQNFRVVRTGAVAAHVTFMDYSSDPENPMEQPLPDARVIADANHDSYSDLNGNLILGSLPPGAYQLRLDPATLPDGYRPISESIPIQVTPGETLRGVTFRLVIPPKPVIRKELP